MTDTSTMSAQEAEIARLQAELEGSDKVETTTSDDAPEQTTEENSTVEEKTEEKVEEKTETDEAPPAKDDHAAWAKLRREKAEAKRQADELAARIAALEAKKTEEPIKAPKEERIPDPITEPEEYLAYKITENDKEIKLLKAELERRKLEDFRAQQYNGAVQEFTNIVNEYTAKNPDFKDASSYLENELKRAIRLQNPAIPSSQIQLAVNNKILEMASSFARQGLNPAEEFYSMAHEFGYKKAAQPAAQPPQKPKTDLSAIEKTRQRSATGLTGSGASGSAGIGIDALSNMRVQDFASLTAQQLRELEEQARNG